MTVTTSRGKTFDVDWMWGPLSDSGELMLQYHDTRQMASIAKDFDGIDHFHRESETEGDIDFDGYTRIMSIVRVNNGAPDTIRITLSKPKES